MKKVSLIATLAAIMMFAFGPTAPALADPYIVVSPMEHDFGDVELGSSSTTMITISNIDGHDLEIYSVSLEGSADFAITMYPNPIVGSGMSTEVEVAFTPSAEGYSSATLDIESNDLGNPLVEVELGGAGFSQASPPITIEDILAFFDAGVEAGTIEGHGCLPGLSEFRLNRFRNMLERAGNLIDRDRIRAACWLLNRVYLRSDGQQWPRDFVEGDDVPELNTMILQLRADMGCE